MSEPNDRTAADWLAAFSARLGLPAPSQDELDTLLELAGVAAHASERIAAPIACWLVGRTDVTLDDAVVLAKEI